MFNFFKFKKKAPPPENDTKEPVSEEKEKSVVTPDVDDEPDEVQDVPSSEGLLANALENKANYGGATDDSDNDNINIILDSPEFTVEELFARGIENWKNASAELKSKRGPEKLKEDGTNKRQPMPKILQGPLSDPNYDPGFDPEMEAILAPKRKDIFVTKKATLAPVESDISVGSKTKTYPTNKRRRSSESNGEESERSCDTEGLLVLSIMADVLRVTLVVVIAVALTGIPWFVMESDIDPPQYTFNVTESNICYWFGSTGLLDPQNPCPYRGYNTMDMDGNDCLKWSDVLENKNWVAALMKETNTQEGVLPRQFIELVAKMPNAHKGEDFKAPFCRRLGEKGHLNQPLCFVQGDKKGKQIEVPRISKCWLIPCNVKISNECYRLAWEKNITKEL